MLAHGGGEEEGTAAQSAGSLASVAAFATVTSLFFGWGFVSANNDPLIAALREIFTLSYTEALLTQIVSFVAFGLMSLPAAALLHRLGSNRTILLALATMIAGCLIVQMTAVLTIYHVVLLGLFVLASGLTMLQVAANPLAATLGPPERSHFRLTFAQAFNSLGVVFGVHIGSRIMLTGEVFSANGGHSYSDAERLTAIASVNTAFLLIAGLLLTLMLVYWSACRTIDRVAVPEAPEVITNPFVALRSKWTLFGAVAIALYVGAEVSIGSIMINFLNQAEILGLSFDEAGSYLANLYWGGALVGRFLGSALLTRIRASVLLAIAATGAVTMCGLALLMSGTIAGYAALAVGLFNSIMFPTIFTLTLERSGVSRAATSGLLFLAIAWGAPLPLVVGLVADATSLSGSFVVPAIAYLFIVVFAVSCTQYAPRLSSTSRA